MILWKSSQNFQSHKIEKKNAQKGLFGDAYVYVPYQPSMLLLATGFSENVELQIQIQELTM
jgi:rhamnose utilization protein RhaD (predicted bifunctional aldolase and dehydrogenase)